MRLLLLLVAYRPPRSEYSFCCPNQGGTPAQVQVQMGVPHPWPGVPQSTPHLDLARVPPSRSVQGRGSPPASGPGRGTPLHMDLAGVPLPLPLVWTDKQSENITSRLVLPTRSLKIMPLFPDLVQLQSNFSQLYVIAHTALALSGCEDRIKNRILSRWWFFVFS